MTNQQAPEAPRGTAADGKTELFNVTGYPLMVRAVDFNRLHAENERLAALVEAQQPARATVWVSDLLCSLRPGGTWVIPRSVSTVLVLSEDPRIVMAHTIFPDTKLIELLRRSGWTVQRKQPIVR